MRLDLNESREGSFRRGRGRSFHVEGPKTENKKKKKIMPIVNPKERY